MISTIQLIQNKFSHAASSYLENANIQPDPARRITNILKIVHNQGLILDLGCGPGTLEHDKTLSLPVIGFDLSLNMLKNSNAKIKINGDAAFLPFASDSFSTIISNLMIQWPLDKNSVIQEAFRVLKPNGNLIITTLIKPSLFELQQAWSKVDEYSHTLEFQSKSEFLNLFLENNFEIKKNVDWDEKIFFSDVFKLLNHFKLTGTGLYKSHCNSGLGGKYKIKKLVEAFERIRTTNGIPLTYAYMLVHATKINKNN